MGKNKRREYQIKVVIVEPREYAIGIVNTDQKEFSISASMPLSTAELPFIEKLLAKLGTVLMMKLFQVNEEFRERIKFFAKRESITLSDDDKIKN